METQEQTSQAQEKKPAIDREITIHVEASELFWLPPTEKNIDDHTSLTDDEGFSSEFGDKNADYETIVFMNKKITWSIETADPNGVDRGYTVALMSVTHNPTAGNPQFFNRNPLPVRNDGTVEGVIARNPNLPNKDDSYTINFTITHEGVTLPYPLDPKLKINSGD